MFFQLYSHANSTHGNVVRVAPRPKISSATTTPTYSYNPATPSSTFMANSHQNPSFTHFTTVNSVNYPNGSTMTTAPTTTNMYRQHAPAPPPPPPPTTANMKLPMIAPIRSNSMIACNPFLAKSSNVDAANYNQKPLYAPEKKFNSLKTTNAKKAPQFYSMRLNKCKRHQSFSNEPQKLVLINNATANGLPYMGDTQNNQHIQQGHHRQSHDANGRRNEQPLYENLTDSIQILETSAPNEIAFAAVIDDFNLDNERNSIYRSDSGISNSSYECITPVPAPRTNPRKCRSVPVYMNLPNQYGSGRYMSKGKGACVFIRPITKCKNGNRPNKPNTNASNTQITDANALLFNYEVCVHYYQLTLTTIRPQIIHTH